MAWHPGGEHRANSQAFPYQNAEQVSTILRPSAHELAELLPGR